MLGLKKPVWRERKQDWLVQKFGIQRLQRFDKIQAESPFLLLTLEHKRRLCSLGAIITLRWCYTRQFATTIFLRNTALQHCYDIISNSYNIVPTLQRCVALKIVVANRPVFTTLDSAYSCLSHIVPRRCNVSRSVPATKSDERRLYSQTSEPPTEICHFNLLHPMIKKYFSRDDFLFFPVVSVIKNWSPSHTAQQNIAIKKYWSNAAITRQTS